MTSIIYLKECASTNEEISHFLTPDDIDFHAVYTFSQTKGKGQYGNSWESSENLNLAFTLAVPSDRIKIPNNLFNFHTAVLLADFIAIMTKIPVEIKWPNDIIIKNKKVSGILIEKKNMHGTPYFIIGIGLNILQTDFVHLPKAGSLLTQTGLTFNPDEVAHSLYNFLLEHLAHEIAEEEILEKLNQKLFRKNVVSVFNLNGLRQNGIIKNADENGFLWVELENDGLKKFYHKEIELLY
ncbi:biotin--[acetyl-CoA-carboxylase] ligase [Kaistella sp. DKR-2]|uniref:biotin--[acetyl-CoA-carboxylase] ligase n=1 Tax=Kaistella soli TaxID=2849654 RepID=UPI001C27EEB8|nr:biotin--[acetyl-CoA-carboxylase] ligase [Kaistella soli]MBU8883633.1 biotin--[acetyl-CoA-carboxylase] ligase [Kaistella soli]